MALLVVMFLTVLGNVRPSCPLVTCRTSSSVQEGEPSRVACYFVHDLRKNKTDFRIVHYPQESHNKPDNVLECTYRENRAYPTCTAANGYKFDGEFGTQVTISIPFTTKGHEGTYVCESGHSDFQQSRDCSLQVNKANATLSAVPSNKTSLSQCQTQSPVTEGEPSFVKCAFMEDPNVNKQNFRVLRYDSSHNDSLPEQIMDCTWHAGEDKPICRIHRGYSFDNHIGKQMTLTIPKATLNHAGKYACQETGISPARSICCLLEVNSFEKVAMATKCETSGQAELGKTASVTCMFPFNIDDTDVGIDHYEIMEDGSVSPLRRQIVHFNRTTYATGNGYKYVDSKNRSKLEIRIGHLEHHQLGVYVCRLLSTYPETKLQNCSLTLSESADASNSSKTVIIAASVVSIVGLSLLLLLLVVVKCVRYQRKKRKKRNAEQRELPEESNMMEEPKSP